MRNFLSLIFFLGLSIACNCQDIVFVKDSIMNDYMKSGFANKEFRPKGDTNKKGMREGKWKNYEVQKNFTVVEKDNSFHMINGYFLLYDEGTYADNNKDGVWTFWVIEDKTFKKIKQSERIYKNGKLNGHTKYFYPSGKIARETEHINDTITGLDNSYYPDGVLFSTLQYLNQKNKDSVVYLIKRFYHSGVLKIQTTIVKDEDNGQYLSYYENKTLQESHFSKFGKADSTYKYYYSNGQLWTEKQYKNGLLWNVISNYTRNGVARDKGTLVNGNGTVILYDEDGNVYSILHVENGTVKNEEKIKPDPFKNPR